MIVRFSHLSGECGTAFSLCAEHVKAQKVPVCCVLEVLAQGQHEACDECLRDKQRHAGTMTLR